MSHSPSSPPPSRSGVSLGVRLSAILAALGGINGIFLPFFPVWLSLRGFSEAEIAVVLTVPIVARIVATPILATIADRTLHPAKVLLALNLVMAAGYVILIAIESKLAIAVVFVIIAVAQAPGLVFGDVLVTAAAQHDRSLNYGHIRMWASIAFLACNLVGGTLVGWYGADIVDAALAALGILAALSVLPHPGLRDAGRPAFEPSTSSSAGISPILLVVVVAAGCAQASHSLLYAFASIHWKSLGWSGPAIGGLWALGVIVEVGLFIMAGHLVRSLRAGIVMLAVGSAAAAVRFTAMAFDPGAGMTIALQALHAGSFGASHLGMIALLAALSPPGQRARLQAIATSVNGVLMAAATLASGPAYGAFGGGAYLFMVPFGVVALVLCGVIWRMAALQQGAPDKRSGNPE